MAAQQYESAFDEMRDDPYKPNGNGQPGSQPTIPVLSQATFLKGFIPPSYLVDGVLQRAFIYALTGRTGHAKTAIALVLARAVGCEDPDAKFAGHSVEKGRVLYLVGENADDIRARVFATNAFRTDDPSRDQIYFIPGVFRIPELRARVELEADKLGGFDLILVDTSAAYFHGDDENNNTQAGAYARSLRSLITVPGRPCVIALCHPAKYVNEPSQLLPRGGGAYLAEVDGNLSCWRHDDNLVEVHHTDKFRGPGFEPITFKVEKITTPKLVDAKGRQIPTVRAIALSEEEEAEETRRTRKDEDRLLVALLINPNRSHADLARACDFFFESGEPAKSRLQRTLRRLEQTSPKLITPNRSYWALTVEGRKLAQRLHDQTDDIVEDRCGATHSRQPFVAKVGKRCGPTVPCAHCYRTGDVHRISDGRLPKGQRHAEALHKGCAEDWFNGKPSPETSPEPGLLSGPVEL
jgi:hypothetical protein